MLFHHREANNKDRWKIGLWNGNTWTVEELTQENTGPNDNWKGSVLRLNNCGQVEAYVDVIDSQGQTVVRRYTKRDGIWVSKNIGNMDGTLGVIRDACDELVAMFVSMPKEIFTRKLYGIGQMNRPGER